MTKDEFIDRYIRDSRINPAYRTPSGFTLPNRPARIATPCDCGEEGCEGWAMIRKDEFS